MISVIICTHNPRREYLHRTLISLKAQTLPTSEWELIIIDNASMNKVSDSFELSWHPNGRHVEEERLGLTVARLRAVDEARGSLLVFVDDDNLLDPDYLLQALSIAENYPHIGVFGGSIRPEFEEIPPEWTRRYWTMLALRELDRDLWSNLYIHETAPCGAGQCVRRIVGMHYSALVKGSSTRLRLDRQGQNLSSGGDSDIAFTACDIGLGTGLFCSLRLIHLMPKQRLEESYLLRLSESIEHSRILLEHSRGRIELERPLSLLRKVLLFVRSLKVSSRERRMLQACARGRERAFIQLAQEK